jgi:hypothetical protein
LHAFDFAYFDESMNKRFPHHARFLYEQNKHIDFFVNVMMGVLYENLHAIEENLNVT